MVEALPLAVCQLLLVKFRVLTYFWCQLLQGLRDATCRVVGAVPLAVARVPGLALGHRGAAVHIHQTPEMNQTGLDPGYFLHRVKNRPSVCPVRSP